MKALKYTFLVMMLAMTKSWFATAEQGHADYASTTIESDSVTITHKGQTIKVNGQLIERTEKGTTKTRVVGGKAEKIQSPDVVKTEARIALEDCASCTITVPVADLEDFQKFIEQQGKILAEKREKEEAAAKRLEERKKKCEVIDINGETKETSKADMKNVDDAKALISCLDENELLKLSKVRPRLTTALRALLAHKDAEERNKGQEILDALANAENADRELRAYVKGLDNYSIVAEKIIEEGEYMDHNSERAINYLLGCTDPGQTQFSLRVPFNEVVQYPNGIISRPRYSCHSLGVRAGASVEALRDNYGPLNGLSCDFIGTSNNGGRITNPFESNGFTSQRNCSVSNPFGDDSDRRTGIVVTHDGNGNGMFSRDTSFGGSAPQIGAPVNFGMHNRTDMGALNSHTGVQPIISAPNGFQQRQGGVQQGGNPNAPVRRWVPGQG